MANFWKAKVYNLETQSDHEFIVQSPHDEERTLEVLAEIHPEYETIELTPIERPEWITNSWAMSS